MRFSRSSALAFGVVLSLIGGMGAATTATAEDPAADTTPLESIRPPLRPAPPTSAATPGTGTLQDIVLQVPDDQAIPERAARRAAPERGPVTNLPMPRFVSMKASKGNARRGPSRTHKIDWVYVRKDQPFEITAEFGHWRRVRDHEGLGGWVHYSLLSGVRTVLVEADEIALHSRPDDSAPLVAKLEHGVVARLGDCSVDWCRLSVSGYRGWTHKTGLWGVDPDEIRD